ncbi:hypothetical protein E1B28_010712 [Marasmius oreades]|uniref:Biotrophy-associated secreted protein 2 n=1 Tax=Marasmius oreades TaxID=181124 RepID=A0A9P7RXR0_9AGAR|nr:uncharacterized protein E1B28_010712 [Marasmius oreades]KAG7091691.1 hypothetical protein E1B28_010712 [Marasmius oreades]
MAKFSLILALLSVNLVVATYIPRAAPGTQFITGPCNVDADCASGCCGVNSGKCAGAIIALTRDGGCGRGDAQSNSRAAAVLRGNCPGTKFKREIELEIEARAPLSPDPDGVRHVGNGKGEQFITGQCLSNADCASGCCATLGNIGICSGPLAADQQGKTGCGFSGAPRGGAPPPPPANNGGASPPSVAPAGGPATSGNTDIGANCASDSDCKTACCGFNTGKCALAKTAPGSDGGCGKGEAAPNTRAANVINGNAPVC